MRKKSKSKGIGRDIAAIMRGNKNSDTRPELTLRSLLRYRGLLGYRIHLKGLIGKPDIVYSRWKVAVFLHGCFWHDCPACGKERPRTNAAFWAEKIAANRIRDDTVRCALEDLGYTVVVVWEHELRVDPEGAVARVEAALEDRRRQVSPDSSGS